MYRNTSSSRLWHWHIQYTPFLFHVDSNFLVKISGLKMFARDIELSNDKIVSIMQQPEVSVNVTFRVMQTLYSWVRYHLAGIGIIVSLNTGLTDIYCLKKKIFRFFSDRGTRTEPLKVVEASSVATCESGMFFPDSPNYSHPGSNNKKEGYNKLRYLC
jgi:hypothetical protein